MCEVLKVVNKCPSVINKLYIHHIRSSTTLTFKAADNSKFLSNNEAGLTPKEALRRS